MSVTVVVRVMCRIKNSNFFLEYHLYVICVRITVLDVSYKVKSMHYVVYSVYFSNSLPLMVTLIYVLHVPIYTIFFNFATLFIIQFINNRVLKIGMISTILISN